MRLAVRSTLFDRRHAATPAGGEKPPAGEAGASSESWYAELQGGGPDVNPDLTGSAKFPIFEEMALTDPTIKSLLAFQSLPVRSAVWSLEPRVDDEPAALAIRDAVAWNFGLEGELGEMDLSWGASIGRTIVSALKCGPAIEEIVWDTDGREWRDADGDAHELWPIAQLAPRPARSIGLVRRERGRVVEITQTWPGTKPIPAEKVSYVVFDPDETGRWEGSSMIRPAWAAWRAKKALQIAAGIGWDRFASGIPVVYHPDNPDAETRAKRIGEQIRQHERARVNFPTSGPSQGGNRPDSEWFLELINGSGTLADPVPLLRYFTEQETEAGLAHFSRLGTTESGSRAVGEVQIDPFYLAVQAVASEVARERERQVFRQFVTVNFGQEAAEVFTPRLVVSRVQARNVEVVSRALAFLAPMGFTLTIDDENDLREMLGLGRIAEAADAAGIPREAMIAAMREAGLDAATLAAIMEGLPDGMGVARNRVPEGAGLLEAA